MILSFKHSALILSLSGLLLTSSTKAIEIGAIVEPGVSYQQGKGLTAYPMPFSSSTTHVKGVGALARVGAHVYDVIFAGIDARYGIPLHKDASNNIRKTAEQYSFAPFVGVQMPKIGARIWGEYVFAGTLDPKQSGSVDLKFSDGTGWRVGAGFRVFFVSVNLEYEQIKYKTLELERIGGFATNTALSNLSFKDKTWIASVTFPIELPFEI